MTMLFGKSTNYRKSALVTLLGLAAICGAATPVLGQETVAGKFTLSETTRFGKKFLPAGVYTFSIEPVGILQSVSSIQAAPQVVRVIVRPETKAGPAAIILAIATRSPEALDSSKLVLTSINNGMAMHSMYLDKQGLVLNFDWWNEKDKTQVLSQVARPEPASASKSTD
jgi:hypothetical protein